MFPLPPILVLITVVVIGYSSVLCFITVILDNLANRHEGYPRVLALKQKLFGVTWKNVIHSPNYIILRRFSGSGFSLFAFWYPLGFTMNVVKSDKGLMKRLHSDAIDCDISQNDLCVSANVPTFATFKSMGLRLELLKGIYSCGFSSPSVIQQRAIRQIIDGHDVVAQAQSGTGKTAAFSIGTLQKVDPSQRCLQVITTLSDYLSIRCVSCCGGRSNLGQMTRELSKGAHVVVGTSGRILDLIRQGSLSLNTLRSVVLDEADEMLNRGLRQQLEAIFRYLPTDDQLRWSTKSRPQVVIVSATLPAEQLEVVHKFTKNPIDILVPRDELSLSGISQYYIDVGSESWKFESLCDLFSNLCVAQTVVFVGTRVKVDWLSGQLRRAGFTVSAVHGQLDQSERDQVMDQFRSGKSRILVCSDVWARGIDVQSVGLVVNYDLPPTSSDYLHRIGRSGRFGRKGLAVSLVAGQGDRTRLDGIACYFGVAIAPAPARLESMLMSSSDRSICADWSQEPGEHADPVRNKKRKKKNKKKKKKSGKKKLSEKTRDGGTV